MSNTLLICKDPDHYRHGYDMVFYWESFDESYGAYSIPKIVEAKSESLRSSYLDLGVLSLMVKELLIIY